MNIMISEDAGLDPAAYTAINLQDTLTGVVAIVIIVFVAIKLKKILKF